jgi:hypothetical protein
MDALSAFGLFAVTAMLVTYALEPRHPGLILAFAAACAMGSAYGFLQGAWPFGLVEAIWALVAVRRWYSTARWSKSGFIPPVHRKAPEHSAARAGPAELPVPPMRGRGPQSPPPRECRATVLPTSTPPPRPP